MMEISISISENARKFFNKWLLVARTARHRRGVLQQKEEEVKLRTIEIGWDRWRERFQEERLKPLVSLILWNLVVIKK